MTTQQPPTFDPYSQQQFEQWQIYQRSQMKKDPSAPVTYSEHIQTTNKLHNDLNNKIIESTRGSWLTTAIVFILVLIFVGVFIFLYVRHENKIKDIAALPTSTTTTTTTPVPETYHYNDNYRYFDDFFHRIPKLLASYIYSTNSVAVAVTTDSANLTFVLSALTNAADNTATLSSKNGLTLTTTTTSGDGAGILSRTNLCNTDTEFTVTFAFTLPSITNDSTADTFTFKAGLVLLEADAQGSDDANQAFLLYDPNNSYSYGTTAGTGDTTKHNLFFVYSIAGNDYVTMLPLAAYPSSTMTSTTKFIAKIRNDASRTLSLEINGATYSLNSTTSGIFTDVAEKKGSVGTNRSLAMTAATGFKFNFKVITRASASSSAVINYVKIMQKI